VKHYVLAIDPGLTTGICLIKRTDDNDIELLWSDELDWINTARRVDETLREYGGADVDVVLERFTITQQTAKNSQQQWSIEIIGMCRLMSMAHGAGEITLQAPSDAKRFASNPRLKAVDLWHVGGGGHALDAIRHGLLRLTRSGWSDRRLLHD
jgi:hypothetical protein